MAAVLEGALYVCGGDEDCDGAEAESPVLRVEETVWPIYVPIPSNATFLRLVSERCTHTHTKTGNSVLGTQ